MIVRGAALGDEFWIGAILDACDVSMLPILSSFSCSPNHLKYKHAISMSTWDKLFMKQEKKHLFMHFSLVDECTKFGRPDLRLNFTKTEQSHTTNFIKWKGWSSLYLLTFYHNDHRRREFEVNAGTHAVDSNRPIAQCVATQRESTMETMWV